MNDKSIDFIKESVAQMDHLISIRNAFCELREKINRARAQTNITLDDIETYDISILIISCNEKIDSLKKQISNALYPTESHYD